MTKKTPFSFSKPSTQVGQEVPIPPYILSILKQRNPFKNNYIRLKNRGFLSSNSNILPCSMGLRPIQVSSYPFIFEASGDSEDDYSLTGSTGCECDMSYAEVADDDDDDDAESCSCDSWGINAANGCVDDDIDDEQGGSHGGNEDYGNDEADRWNFGKTGVPNLFKGCVPCDQEDEEIVEATMVLREAMDAMEDKEFWVACLATGYP